MTTENNPHKAEVIDDGGSAFPTPDCSNWDGPRRTPGMSLRMWLAGMAMQGLLASGILTRLKDDPLQRSTEAIRREAVIRESMAIADAMLSASKSQPQEQPVEKGEEADADVLALIADWKRLKNTPSPDATGIGEPEKRLWCELRKLSEAVERNHDRPWGRGISLDTIGHIPAIVGAFDALDAAKKRNRPSLSMAEVDEGEAVMKTVGQRAADEMVKIVPNDNLGGIALHFGRDMICWEVQGTGKLEKDADAMRRYMAYKIDKAFQDGKRAGEGRTRPQE